MSNRILKILAALLFPLQAFAQQGTSVTSAALDAFVNRDGSVSLSYDVGLTNAGDSAPLTSFTISLPSSDFNVEQIRAWRCDGDSARSVERNPYEPAERESTIESTLPVRRHPDPDMNTEITLDLSQDPLGPGESGSLCVVVLIPNYVSKDLICSNSAYVSVRPTLYYGGNGGLSDVYVNLKTSSGIRTTRIIGFSS